MLHNRVGFVFGALFLAIAGCSVLAQSHSISVPQIMEKPLDTLKRDQVVSEMMIQLGSTLGCLLNILDADINMKLNRLWDGNWKRVQNETIFKLTDDQLMYLVYATVRKTLKATQAIHPQCASMPYPGATNNKLPAAKVMEDLRDYCANIGVTMKCLLAHDKPDTRIHSIFAKSFVRYHDCHNESKTSLDVTQQELALILADLKSLETNCQMVRFADEEPCNSSVL